MSVAQPVSIAVPRPTANARTTELLEGPIVPTLLRLSAPNLVLTLDRRGGAFDRFNFRETASNVGQSVSGMMPGHREEEEMEMGGGEMESDTDMNDEF